MKILYVPQWLKTQVKNRGASQHVFTNVKELLGIVSAEDVGFYLYLNLNIGKYVPPGVMDTFKSWGCDIYDQLLKMDSLTVEKVTKSWVTYDIDEKLGRPTESEGKVLTCDLMNEDTITFTHVPATDNVLKEVGSDPLRWLYNRLILQYHSFVPFEELAGTDLILNYLRLLAVEPEENATNRKFEPQVAEDKSPVDTGA